MAQAAGYHVSHFTQLFQKQMGISPGQFIQKKKSDTAAQLLTSTDLPVAEIADALGFSNPFYFSSFFKKQTGMTPSAYRTLYLRTYLQSKTPLQATGYQICSAASSGVFDPRGSRQISMQAWLLGSLLAGIKNLLCQNITQEVFFIHAVFFCKYIIFYDFLPAAGF